MIFFVRMYFSKNAFESSVNDVTTVSHRPRVPFHARLYDDEMVGFSPMWHSFLRLDWRFSSANCVKTSSFELSSSCAVVIRQIFSPRLFCWKKKSFFLRTLGTPSSATPRWWWSRTMTGIITRTTDFFTRTIYRWQYSTVLYDRWYLHDGPKSSAMNNNLRPDY